MWMAGCDGTQAEFRFWLEAGQRGATAWRLLISCKRTLLDRSVEVR